MEDKEFVSNSIKKQFGVYYLFDYFPDKKTENKEKTPASQKQDNPQKSQPVAYPTGSEGDDPLFDML